MCLFIYCTTTTFQQDLVLIPAARYLLPSDQGYKMRYNPLHKVNINKSHELIVRDVSYIPIHYCRTCIDDCSTGLLADCCDLSDVALQFNARASANLTLIDDSCPAGFQTVEGIIPGRYSCQCSKINLNIQRCDETTGGLLLKVRVLCA